MFKTLGTLKEANILEQASLVHIQVPAKASDSREYITSTLDKRLVFKTVGPLKEAKNRPRLFALFRAQKQAIAENCIRKHFLSSFLFVFSFSFAMPLSSIFFYTS